MHKRLTLRLSSRSVPVRLPMDADVVTALKARYGWRWKMAANAILKDWLRTHLPA